jgi:catechol 2,3-dioxygenase-like lactoylglutathione lyase family enzyme
MKYRLEMFVIPVSDVDRSKAFYEMAGFVCDNDHRPSPDFRVVQMTPPGSECSIAFGMGMPLEATPGDYQGMHLIVKDVEAAIADLRDRGIEVDGPFHFGPQGRTPGLPADRVDYATFASFSDPDGNGWLLQEITSRPE